MQIVTAISKMNSRSTAAPLILWFSLLPRTPPPSPPPWPGTYSRLGGRTVKFWRTEVCKEKFFFGGERPTPGTVAAVTRDAIIVQTGDGLLAVRELQPEGKKRMDAGAFLRGYPLHTGDKMEG